MVFAPHRVEAQELQVPKDWHFAWDTLIAPSQTDVLKSYPLRDADMLWNDDQGTGQGKATYYCTLTGLDTTTRLGLKVHDVLSSYRLFANGKEIASNGVVGSSEATTQSKFLPVIVNLPSDTEIELVLQVANYSHARGGVARLPELSTLDSHIKRQRLINFGAAGISAAFIFLGLLIAGTLRIHKAGVLALWFAINCFSLAYRAVGSGDYLLHHLVPSMPFVLSLRLEYITYYLLVLSFWEISNKIVDRPIPKLVLTSARGAMCFLIGCVILFDPIIFTSMLILGHVVTMTSLGYGVYAMVLSLRRGRAGTIYSTLTSIGFAVLFVTTALGVYSNIVGWNFSDLVVYLSIGIELLLVFYHANAKIVHQMQVLQESAVAASKAKSQFLATMSHEIRTPMNGVLGMTSLLADTKLTLEQRQFVDTIRLSGANLITIINDILDFSKVDAGHMKLERQPIKIVDVVRDTTSLVAGNATQKGINLHVDIDARFEQVCVEADPTRISQILTNLLSNAIKFTEEGSVVLTLNGELSEDQVNLQIAISDSGIGMNEEQLAGLFTSFAQADNSISRRFGGTGLGLAISKQLVELMGGSIDVTSDLGKGSTFTFLVPLMRLADVKKPSKEELASAAFAKTNGKLAEVAVEFPKLRVLVAEDHPVNQKLIATILRKWGYEPDLVGNGLEAIEAIDRQPYDLIFMDMQMPECDGITATKAIRKRHAVNDVRIVALTANAQSSDRDACLAAGMQDFIAKPFKPSEIKAILLTSNSPVSLEQ